MYTIEMAKAFKAIKPPKGFGVIVYDNENFITIRINPEKLINLTEKQTQLIVDYINNVKETFEKLGATVFLVRDTLENKDESN
jgi:hypothetical protein